MVVQLSVVPKRYLILITDTVNLDITIMDNKFNNPQILSPKVQQTGATLIEAMVSLFVFAVGALGIAAMQTTSLVKVDDSKQRSLAIWKAQELADRMRVTITAQRPDGLLAEYVAKIGNDKKGIGKFETDGDGTAYACPGSAPQRCDDVDGSAASACSQAELIEFDVWSVLCDENSGLRGASADGAIGLRDVELAAELVETTVDDKKRLDARIYLEWVNRDSLNDEDLENASDVVNASTDLCGEDIDVDTRLDAYCLRVQ